MSQINSDCPKAEQKLRLADLTSVSLNRNQYVKLPTNLNPNQPYQQRGSGISDPRNQILKPTKFGLNVFKSKTAWAFFWSFMMVAPGWHYMKKKKKLTNNDGN